MTRYAYEPGRLALVACWGTGRGDLAETVSVLPPGAAHDAALHLASTLTGLSRFLWNAYTRPASAAGDPAEPNSQAWQRAEERARFSVVLPAIRTPELPTQSGLLSVSYSPVEESAHRVGRALRAISDAGLTERVAADVRCELDAIESAERGDLSGRAQQAVLLSRADASPVQVQAADALLRASPLGAGELFTDLDPTAAAVAAAHWLQAAADVVAPMAGIDPAEVVIEADNLEALQVHTPTLVLRRLNDGTSPRQVVVGLVAEAWKPLKAISRIQTPSPGAWPNSTNRPANTVSGPRRSGPGCSPSSASHRWTQRARHPICSRISSTGYADAGCCTPTAQTAPAMTNWH